MSALVVLSVTFLLLFAGFLAGSEAAINSISRINGLFPVALNINKS